MQKLEHTSSQNAMIGILAGLFRESGPDEIDILCYFLLGRTAAGYRGATLDMGEKRVLASISLATGVEEETLLEKLGGAGDLGEVAVLYDVPSDEANLSYFSSTRRLTIQSLHEGLAAIASSSGTGSDEEKIRTLASLLSAATPRERRYIVRLVMGTMRLGVGEMTILDGLAEAFLGSRKKRQPLEHAFNICSDLGYVAAVLQKSGLQGLERIGIALDRPLRPMLAQRVSSMKQIREKIVSEKISVEEKYDGERIQAHKDGDKVQLFSRRLTDVTEQFPDVVKQVKEHVRAVTVILDGEAVAYDPENESYEPFQTLMQRRRKYRVSRYVEQIPVRYMVFDLVYRDGSSLLAKTYPERRASLEEVIGASDMIAVAGRKIVESLEDIHSFFRDCIGRGLEGVICKSMADDSIYEAGARSWQWIKWKQTYGSELPDTLDLVVIGGNYGRGKRTGTCGSLLCATYNPEKDVFETICGLGTGFTQQDLEELPQKLGSFRAVEKPARCRVKKEKFPDYWFEPVFVLEILGSEITRSPLHTCNWSRETGRGMAVRFPRFIRWRPEKSPEQATSSQEIAEIFEQQRVG
jgi:DNA ligase-1